MEQRVDVFSAPSRTDALKVSSCHPGQSWAISRLPIAQNTDRRLDPRANCPKPLPYCQTKLLKMGYFTPYVYIISIFLADSPSNNISRKQPSSDNMSW